MFARRRCLAVIAVAACGEPQVAPPPTPVAPPTTAPTPVPEASPPAPEPPPPPVVEPPAPEEPPATPGVRRWHLAAVRDGTLALHAMTDGAVVVRGDIAFAVAPPRSGPLRRERAWTRGLAFDEPERSATSISAFGGRWPDLAFLTLESESGRVAALYSVLRWQDSAWTREELPAPAGVVPYYAAFAGIPDGPVAGLRSHAVEDSEELDPREDEPTAKKPPRAPKPVLDRMTAEGRTTGPWPALPAGPAGTDLLALANGDLVVVRSGPVVQHWAVGSKSWRTLPAVGYKATGYYDRPTIAGRDPARLYLASCPDTADDVPPNFHMFDGSRWIRLTPPGNRCVYSVAESEDGTVWIVADDTLHRDDPGEPRRWEPVRLPSVSLDRAAAWRPGSYGEPWREYPAEPASEQALTPYSVLALGPDDIWVAATADASRYREPYRRSVVMTTRASKSVLVLPDDDLADLEAHAQDPEVVPTSRESACENIVLDLGETTDAPATARPPALAAALTADDADLRRLSVVAADLGGRHGVQALWLADSPGLQESYSQLTALAERLRDAHPRVRLLCRTPIITRVLP